MLGATRTNEEVPDYDDLSLQVSLVAGLATIWIWSSPGLLHNPTDAFAANGIVGSNPTLSANFPFRDDS
jgi:hypothetical protein